VENVSVTTRNQDVSQRPERGTLSATVRERASPRGWTRHAEWIGEWNMTKTQTMKMATGGFEIASWDEATYEELDDGARLARASVTQKFTGDVAGDGAVEWLMAYRADGTAFFVGLQRVRGAVDRHDGAFVLETHGEFDGKVAKWSASVVPGSGSGELQGLKGAATFAAPLGGTASFEMEYEIG